MVAALVAAALLASVLLLTQKPSGSRGTMASRAAAAASAAASAAAPRPRRALVVIAPDKFQDAELRGTLQALERHHFSVTLASSKAGKCSGALGGSAVAEVALKDVDTTEFDRVSFTGGPGTPALQHDPDAHRVAKEFASAGKVVGAICLGPTILAEAGVLRGHEATVWTSADQKQAKLLEHFGATFTGKPVTVSGAIVTGNGPSAAEAYGEAFATAFSR